MIELAEGPASGLVLPGGLDPGLVLPDGLDPGLVIADGLVPGLVATGFEVPGELSASPAIAPSATEAASVKETRGRSLPSQTTPVARARTSAVAR